ncbi:MAG: hypothetical protein AB7L13_11135 [Acidimicrobiia bacterium]
MSITVGAIGLRQRASVDEAGRITFDDGSAPLDWWIGAADRWHTPPEEKSLRQRRVGGAPVMETMVRVPAGDVVQRVYVAAAFGGVVVVEIDNQSPEPVAVAFSRSDIVCGRAASVTPPPGITLPPESAIYPVTHRTTLRAAIGAVDVAALGSLPAAGAVASGWAAHVNRGSRYELPDDAAMESVIADRAAVVLDPLPSVREAPSEFLLAVGERSRMGDDVTAYVEHVAEAAQRAAKIGQGYALGAAAEVMRAAGELRAAADIERIAARHKLATQYVSETPAARLAGLRDSLVDDSDPWIDLAPAFPAAWYGQSVSAFDVPSRFGRVSYGVRWHGERPALLWDIEGAGDVSVRASSLDPAWRSADRRGDALLSAPR